MTANSCCASTTPTPSASKPEFEDAILEDLGWLGIMHDRFARQSERAERHEAAVEKLIVAGRLYPCFETPEELERKRKRQIASRRPPVYDRAALKLTTVERAKLEASKADVPHWRFKLSRDVVKWHDAVRGPVEIDTAHLSDPVLIREDGRFLYTLPSIVDDIEFGVTHIVRGEDHVTNTAAQIEIFQALGAAVPAFAHFPLLVGAGGEALSKRLGSVSLRSFREDGIEALALACYLAKTGTSDTIELRAGLDDLAAEFDFAKIGRAPAHFDPAELMNLNAKLLHGLPYAAVEGRLSALGVAGGEAFWEAARPNLTRLSDAADLWTLVAGPVDARDRGRRADRQGCRAAAARALWRGDLAGMDQGGLGRHGPQGPGPVPSLAARAHRPRAWTGAQKAATPHRARQDCCAPQWPHGLGESDPMRAFGRLICRISICG